MCFVVNHHEAGVGPHFPRDLEHGVIDSVVGHALFLLRSTTSRTDRYQAKLN
ncbi:MAG: hypothetical protein JKY95_08175 [Planctomycetaceae bacterium]|nr:hypothetical protein [Planctomycetaceae bacterium]